MLKPHRMISQRPAPPAKMKIALILGKNLRKKAIKPFPNVPSHAKTSPKYFVTDSP